MSEQSRTEPAITSQDIIPVRRALLSVYDKRGLGTLALMLAARGVEFYSTGGTEKYLRSIGLKVTSVSEFTHSPEIFGGRLKTLHPMVHGGLLFRRDVPSQVEEAKANGIVPIDLLVVNLYPFEETVARPGATEAEIIEQIDIGGPAMLRSAAKNFESVALLTSPDQYERFLEPFTTLNGATDLAMRKTLAREAFVTVAEYDRAIARYFQGASFSGMEYMEQHLELSLPLIGQLRYGENPHQSAALYGGGGTFGEDFTTLCTKLWGKELSYNNLLDISAALELIAEFLPADPERPIAAILKHTNPCGVAEGATQLEAFERAFTTDPESPFGGIIIVNTKLEAPLAERLNQFFSEVILAPEYDALSLSILKLRKDRRLLTYSSEAIARSLSARRELRSVVGGVLMQTPDTELVTNSELTSVTTHPVSDAVQAGLLFAMKIAKHLKSNAIAFCGKEKGYLRTLGLGAGQTSRVEATRIAIDHAQRHGLPLDGSFVASDAFYPFADGLIEAANAGAIAIVEPGGSIRDAEVIHAAEERGIALVMTGMRHFHH